ncbi:MAG: ribulose-phosphate 3-epimerase [Candidatus Omnitrophica bacterium CG_4_9_14_0_2_um_filter_42_8]|nr:MAG: ribulose-phosphate 3-epimerase [Candidatus Omnitrophica bacterium CG_4_9_14_0_2_um_filter_42_8]
MNKKILVAPSLLSADFSILKEEIKKVEDSGADMIHVDVMDGHFVPNITIGPLMVEAARRCTKMVLDVHLMIEEPHRFIKDFVEAGSDIITIHAEAYAQGSRLKAEGLKKGVSKSTDKIDEARVKEVLAQIKSFGKTPGLSLNPDSPLCIEGVLKDADMVLFMSVHPGFGGQSFMESVLPKVKALRKIYSGDIEVDGGINDKNAKLVIESGANILVAGSYFFGAKNKSEAVNKLRIQ